MIDPATKYAIIYGLLIALFIVSLFVLILYASSILFYTIFIGGGLSIACVGKYMNDKIDKSRF